MFAFSFIAGGLPPAPPCDGVCGVHPYGSPHGRRMVAAWSPHGRRIDKTVHCIISVLYVTILIKSEREKLNKTTQQLSVFIWHEFLSLYCSRNVVVCSPHRQDSALYNFCSICYNSDKERKREREKERNLASQRDRLQGASPPHPRRRGQSTRPP